MSYSLNAQKLMLEFQQDELNSSLIYGHFAKMVKDEKNKKVLLQIAQDEAHHAAIWKHYTQKEVRPNMLKVWWFRFLTYILGYTFVIKLLELHEYEGINGLQQLKKEIPEVSAIIEDEKSMRQS